jgi:cytochrome c-type biogenesis protein CcmE
MKHMRTKLIAAGLVVAAAVALLAVAGVRDGWVYFLPVDQFLADTNYHGQRVRLHGKVGQENFHADSAMLVANFDLLGETGRVRVQYEGVIPEMFEAGRDVVAEGAMTDGVFRADTLMTKCASKYESSDGQAPHADPHQAEAGHD